VQGKEHASVVRCCGQPESKPGGGMSQEACEHVPGMFSFQVKGFFKVSNQVFYGMLEGVFEY
jgi:hypothetical protein